MQFLIWSSSVFWKAGCFWVWAICLHILHEEHRTHFSNKNDCCESVVPVIWFRSWFVIDFSLFFTRSVVSLVISVSMSGLFWGLVGLKNEFEWCSWRLCLLWFVQLLILQCDYFEYVMLWARKWFQCDDHCWFHFLLLDWSLAAWLCNILLLVGELPLVHLNYRNLVISI